MIWRMENLHRDLPQSIRPSDGRTKSKERQNEKKKSRIHAIKMQIKVYSMTIKFPSGFTTLSTDCFSINFFFCFGFHPVVFWCCSAEVQQHQSLQWQEMYKHNLIPEMFSFSVNMASKRRDCNEPSKLMASELQPLRLFPLI